MYIRLTSIQQDFHQPHKAQTHCGRSSQSIFSKIHRFHQSKPSFLLQRGTTDDRTLETEQPKAGGWYTRQLVHDRPVFGVKHRWTKRFANLDRMSVRLRRGEEQVLQRVQSCQINIDFNCEKLDQVKQDNLLNSNSKTFSLFDIQSFTGNTDYCISISLHFQELDDFINIGEFFSGRSCFWLSKHSGEIQSLSNSRSRQVEILLLDVTCESFLYQYLYNQETRAQIVPSQFLFCNTIRERLGWGGMRTSFSLEAYVSLSSVDEHLTCNNTHCYPTSKNVEKRSFSGSRDALGQWSEFVPMDSSRFLKHPSHAKLQNSLAQRESYHQSSQSAWLHPAIHGIKQFTRLAFDLNIIVDIIPMKDSCLLLDTGRSIWGSLLSGNCLSIDTVICICFFVG